MKHSFKVLLHKAIFFATCLTILLRYKLHEQLPGVTYPEMNMSRNFFGPAIVARSRSRFYFLQQSPQCCNEFSSIAWRFYTRQRCVQLVSQRHSKIVGQVARTLSSVTAPLMWLLGFSSWHRKISTRVIINYMFTRNIFKSQLECILLQTQLT